MEKREPVLWQYRLKQQDVSRQKKYSKYIYCIYTVLYTLYCARVNCSSVLGGAEEAALLVTTPLRPVLALFSPPLGVMFNSSALLGPRGDLLLLVSSIAAGGGSIVSS